MLGTPTTTVPSSLRPTTFIKRLAPAVLLAVSSLHAQNRALTLDTPGYTVSIEIRCAEGEVACDDVAYRGVSKKSRRAITLKGRTEHLTCADGVSPCRLVGYVFASGEYRYFVSEAGELVVKQGTKVLVKETGKWQ
jgi:hypothetical protein